MSEDINKSYISPIDKFLFEFDKTHKKSASQIKEIKKHARVFALRDNKSYDVEVEEIWKSF